MGKEDTPVAPTLPPGDHDPNVIYIAVGKAIHMWESLEEALVRLALKMAGIPDEPPNYPAYGKKYGQFRQRMAGMEATAQFYFSLHPDQALEGEFAAIVRETIDLSLDRHRIAHGHLTQWGEFKFPTEKGPFEVTATFLFRWAPPFYGIEKLRTNPVGLNGEAIDAISQKFGDLHNKVYHFTEKIPALRPSPEK